MFKKIVALVITSGIGVAHSQVVIDLMACGGFGALHQYHECPTDVLPVDPVTMYLPQSGNTGTAYLWFDSEAAPVNCTSCDNWHWTGVYAWNAPMTLSRYFCTGPLINMGGYYSQACTVTGETMTMILSEAVRTVRGSGSGRGGYATHRVWTLLGGTITIP